ncbi:MAG TPA: single-stranded DNA-binding protein [Mycobacteriales bacterium]|nr:single-stranded DNA-binding protein [Mycobacteriales bacterium]
MPGASETDGTSGKHTNRVQLIGRVSGQPSSLVMPSGDRAVQWRLVVPRPRAAKRSDGRAGAVVDTIECVAWAGGLQRRVERWQIGDIVECEGALRRRFWRTATGPTSRYEVEVHRAHRMRGRSA